MNLLNAINYGVKILQNSNIKTAKLDSEILMSSIIEKERSFIFLNHDKDVETDHFNQFKKLINKRSKGEPVAYLIGKKDFWNFEFKINKNVLVPRPDSELIIEEVLKQTKNKHKLKLLDIGVGSGCLLLSILNEKKRFYRSGH